MKRKTEGEMEIDNLSKMYFLRKEIQKLTDGISELENQNYKLTNRLKANEKMIEALHEKIRPLNKKMLEL